MCAKLPSAYVGSLVRSGSRSLNDWISHVLGQVGSATALNFYLSLKPPLLKLSQELVDFLQEALQIAEVDETVWVVKFMNPKVSISLNKLRTACIELLCTAMAWADFKTPAHSELCAKIISMFF